MRYVRIPRSISFDILNPSMESREIIKEWDFGSDKEIAERLIRLVISGSKTAATGLYIDEQGLPVVGERAAILDTNHERSCVVEYTRVQVKPFREVDYGFALKEGEEYKDIESWRSAHRTFFLREYPGEFTDNSLVICEEFKVVERY